MKEKEIESDLGDEVSISILENEQPTAQHQVDIVANEQLIAEH